MKLPQQFSKNPVRAWFTGCVNVRLCLYLLLLVVSFTFQLLDKVPVAMSVCAHGDD